ncbi:MAG: hypothetical protein GWO38_09280, partial [Phycisphaerae bacterium]|nr:hypothetical protein [Phycisphaerae bacterium]NIX27809.1 hypothetical protein [Phycisphaerae bacterium]
TGASKFILGMTNRVAIRSGKAKIEPGSGREGEVGRGVGVGVGWPGMDVGVGEAIGVGGKVGEIGEVGVIRATLGRGVGNSVGVGVGVAGIIVGV